MLKNKKILLTILMVVLLFLIPNIVKADDENPIEWINVTIPEMIIGEKPAAKENMSIKTNNNLTFEITKVTWEFREENEQGIGAGEMQQGDTFKGNEDYSIVIEYKIPRGLNFTEEHYFKVNNVRSLSGGVTLLTEDDNFFYQRLTMELGKAKAKITYNPEDVCVLVPNEGEVTSALPGKTIRVLPMKEAESWEVTVQGASGACGTVEKADDNGKLPYYEFTMPAENVVITAKYLGVTELTELKKIKITGPYPIVGKELYKKEDYKAVSEDFPNADIKILNVYWEKYNKETKEYEMINSGKFEKNQKYSVNIEIGTKLSETYFISENATFTVNGKEANVLEIGINEDSEIGFYGINYEFDTPIIQYSIIKGADQTYTIGKDKTIEIEVDADFAEFEEVYVDGKLVDKKNYTAKSGSTIITFNEDYLKTLSEGEHTIKIAFKDNGEATTNLTVKKLDTTKDATKAPGTIPHAGGTLAIIASAMLLIAGGIYVFRKNNDLKGI